ncbi:MAG: hypothetical protein AB7R90_18660 [Reyranellaceae bacterium]
MAGGGQGESDDATPEPSRAPELSGRMKHLLFGVRLSAAALPLPPAGDLEELARQLDAARQRRRNSGRRSS